MPARLIVPLSLAVAMLVGRPAPARAQVAAGPLRVALACESSGRTKACPVFLRGLIAKSPLLLDSPRSNAQVVLYVATTEVAVLDRVHLRFVGDLAGAPHELELDVELDTRGSDDAQLAALEPGFVRGIALFVAAIDPGAVEIKLGTASAATAATTATSPWGTEVSAAGFGSWSGKYRTVNLSASASVSRTTPTSLVFVRIGSESGLQRQPTLAVDGNEVSLDTTSWGVAATVLVEHHLDRCWSVAAITSVSRDDPKGQYRFGWRGSAGIEWDRYASDDARGNVLAVAYGLGWQVDGYNFPNELGERFAQYPTHRLAAAGRIRRDKISYGLGLSLDGELLHPARRHRISGSPNIEIALGTHVDLTLSLSLTKRELPEPQIPPDDFEAISRGAYAAPFSAYGSASISIHWDRTNGAQNNRFQEI